MKLYGTPFSYFTAKVTAYLRWKGLDFAPVLATPQVYRDVILPNVGWPVIPVLEMEDGRVVQDSAAIIDAVEAEHPEPPLRSQDPVHHLAALLLQLYADEWMVIPAMHYRWTYNAEWAYRTFGALVAAEATADEQLDAGRKAATRFQGALPALGICEDTAPAIEASYEALLADLEAHFEHHAFLLGPASGHADIALMTGLYAHQLQDPWTGAHMRRLAPRTAAWTEAAHDGARGEGANPSGVPDSLLPVFRRHFEEQVPALEWTLSRFREWAEGKEAGEVVPRAVGSVPSGLGGDGSSMAARTFPLFRLQAVLDAAEADGDAADWLRGIGGGPLLALELPRRLERRKCRLVLAD